MLQTLKLIFLFFFVLLLCASCSYVPHSEEAPQHTKIYVHASAGPNGDGSNASPLRTFHEALDASLRSPRPVQILLAAGTYTLPKEWVVGQRLNIKGVSSSVVFLRAEEASTWTLQERLTLSGVTLLSPWSVVQNNLALHDLACVTDRCGITLERVDDARLSKLHFERGGGLKIMRSKRVHLSTSVFEGARLYVDQTDRVTVQKTALRDVVGPAVGVVKSDVYLGDVEIEDVLEEGGQGGDGVSVRLGSLEMVGGRVERVKDRALALSGSEATLDGVTLRGGGRALLSVQGKSKATLSNTTLEGGSAAIFVADSSLIAETISILSTRETGILTSDGADVTLRKSVLKSCPKGHISLLYEGTKALLEGNLLEGSQDACVRAFQVLGGITMRNNTVRSCVGVGISVGKSREVRIEKNLIESIDVDPAFPKVADTISAVDSSGVVHGNTLRDARSTGVRMIRSAFSIRDNVIEGMGSVGINVLDSEQGTEIQGNTVTRVGMAGVMVAATSADLGARTRVEKNVVNGVSLDVGTGLGDGVVLGLGARADVVHNTLESCAANGVVYVGGARGSISANTLRNNAGYGVRGYCDARTEMVVGKDNVYDGNVSGETSLCP